MSNYSPQFKNDFQHSFMYLHSVPQEENHEQKILRQCQIPGTLSFRLLEEEGENFLQYDFSPYQRACLYFSQRKMRLSHLSALFLSLQNALRNMEEYLLSPSLLSIDWEEIFYDVENQQFLFPLIPFKEEYPEEGLSALLEQVLENIDEEEEAVVLAAFLLYQEQKHGGLQLSRILQILHIQEQKQLAPKSEEKAISSSKTMQKSPRTSSHAFSGEKESSQVSPKPFGGKITASPSSEESETNYTELDLCQCSSSSFQKQEQKTPVFTAQSAVDSDHFQEEHSYTDAANTIPKKKGFLASLHLPSIIASPASSSASSPDSPSLSSPVSSLASPSLSSPVSSLSDREQKKRKKEGRKKMLLGIFLMLFLPLALFYFKGSGFLFRYLPFVILLELALLLYTALDYLILLLSSPGSEDKQKCKTSG